ARRRRECAPIRRDLLHDRAPPARRAVRGAMALCWRVAPRVAARAPLPAVRAVAPPCARVPEATMRRVIGIDPGLAGGLGILDVDDTGALLSVELHRTPRVPVMRGGKRRDEYDAAAMCSILSRAIDGRAVRIQNVEVALEAQ